MKIWDVVDKDGNRTGNTIKRGDQLKEDQYHLVVHIWTINDLDQFLIKKRAYHLELLPGIWATTGGSAIQEENSKNAAVRELREELGVGPKTKNMNKITRLQSKDNFNDI